MTGDFQPRTDSAAIQIDTHGPAIVIVLEVEAAPRIYGSCDRESISRLLADLSDDAQEALKRFLIETGLAGADASE